jgi:hypothetical protein
MAMKLTCPACATAFVLTESQRGKKAVCPSCGESLIVTGAGVAKGNERPLPNPAAVLTGSSTSRLTVIVCVIGAACVFLAVGVGLLIWCLAPPSDQDHADQAQGPQKKATNKVAKNDGNQLLPGPDSKGYADGSNRHQGKETVKTEIVSMKVQQWEYKVVALAPLDLRVLQPGKAYDQVKQADIYTDHFNKLGLDGWEYHTTLTSAAGNIPGDFVIFKRPKG